MNSQSVHSIKTVALFPTQDEAEAARKALQESGLLSFPPSVEAQNDHTPPIQKTKVAVNARGGAIVGAALGGVGASLMYLIAAQANTIATPGVPFAVVLIAGVLLGGGTGTLIGTATGVNISEPLEARGDRQPSRYSVRAQATDEEVKRAVVMLREKGFRA